LAGQGSAGTSRSANRGHGRRPRKLLGLASGGYQSNLGADPGTAGFFLESIRMGHGFLQYRSGWRSADGASTLGERRLFRRAGSSAGSRSRFFTSRRPAGMKFGGSSYQRRVLGT